MAKKPRSRRAVLLALVAINVTCLVATASGLWYFDLQFRLPTPAPPGVAAVPIGAVIALPPEVPVAPDRLTVLHVFNPDCTCSRVNAAHVRTLIARFGDRVSFVALAQGATTAAEARADVERFGLAMPAVADEDGNIAHAAGIWSTPQAAIIDGSRVLRWRGNYNTGRYCTDPTTEYARIALQSMLDPKADGLLARSLEALRAWGCPLPGDRR